MPSLVTTNLPKPKSWDEFEDICTDILKKIWNSSYVTRNGRTGQRQDGVDIFGQPSNLNGNYAAGQCKNIENINIGIVNEEVEKSLTFKPKLFEYWILTTSPRDVNLQEEIRLGEFPYPLRILFWEDICLELSSHQDLLQKYFPNWLTQVSSHSDVINLILDSEAEDFLYNDSNGDYLYKPDIKLMICKDREDSPAREFDETWVRKFPDIRAYVQIVNVFYDKTRIDSIYCAYVDGFRYLIPYPTIDLLTITKYQYKISKILNDRTYKIDTALFRAGISIEI